MIGVLLVLDAIVLLTLVPVIAVVGRARKVTGWRCTAAGGVLAGLAAAGTWMFDLPHRADVVASLVVSTAVFIGLGADMIRLARSSRTVPRGGSAGRGL